MARRGFFAEIQHQAKLAEKQRVRAAKQAQREYAAACREAERARREAQKMAEQLARASQSERKLWEKRAREAHVEAMLAEVEQRNLQIADDAEELDALLLATLDVDDYVDLESLRRTAVHPPFPRPDLEQPIPPPNPVVDPPEPKYVPPAAPTGLMRLLGQGKHERAAAEAQRLHAEAIEKWREQVNWCAARRQSLAEEHAMAEQRRLQQLAAERARYEEECRSRQAQVQHLNDTITKLSNDLSYGVPAAVDEYIGIVLANSVYPEHFPVGHGFKFEAATAELLLRVLIPSPDKLNSVKTFKYTKATDEITSTALSSRDCKTRYADAVHKVALRSLHEVFEADRRGIIKTISLEVGTETIDPATGRNAYIPFVAAGAERESFLSLDLAKVVPEATLAHLGAAVSKNPFGLAPVNSSGVRRA